MSASLCHALFCHHLRQGTLSSWVRAGTGETRGLRKVPIHQSQQERATVKFWLFLGDPGDRINQLFWRCGNWGSEIGGDSANRRQDRDAIPTSTLFSQPQEEAEVSFSLFTAGENRPWCLCVSRSFKGVITLSQSITRVPPGNKHLPFTLVSRTSLAWCWENNMRSQPWLRAVMAGHALAEKQYIPEINPERVWGNEQIKQFPRITTLC